MSTKSQREERMSNLKNRLNENKPTSDKERKLMADLQKLLKEHSKKDPALREKIRELEKIEKFKRMEDLIMVLREGSYFQCVGDEIILIPLIKGKASSVISSDINHRDIRTLRMQLQTALDYLTIEDNINKCVFTGEGCFEDNDKH